MINGTGSLSLRKQDLENQKIPAVGFVKTAFAHKASAGATGFNLASLTIPPEMTANGFSNPPTSQLTGAQLLFYKNNLTLTSSARGLLQQGLSYTIASSSQINFIGFTALAGEIFTGTIDYTAQTGVKVVDARPINATGTLAATTTDFNVGTPFKVAQYSTTQIGGVMVFLDGVLQFRNTNNSSTTLDGNYYEVDAGGGLGTIIRFNLADPDNTRNVLVVSNGLLSERPDGSMMATIESIQGQVNNMAGYVASATGNSTTTVLGAAPSNVDLKAFGDRVLTLEQNRARTDLTNTFTAYQQIPGRTDGNPVSTGYLGEIISSNSVIALSTTSTQFFNAFSQAMQPGRWLVFAGAGNTTGGITQLALVASAVGTSGGALPTDAQEGYNYTGQNNDSILDRKVSGVFFDKSSSWTLFICPKPTYTSGSIRVNFVAIRIG